MSVPLAPNAPFAEVIGDPIVQSKSPVIHGYWLKRLGIQAEYRAHHVLSEDLGDYLQSRAKNPDWRGCNVTMPHKQAVIAHLERLDPTAQAIGAVNTIVREDDGSLTGYNTDAEGFLEPLKDDLARLHLFRMARVLGTGGAARAIIAALAQQKMTLVVAGRDPLKAQALLDELAPNGEHYTASLDQFADLTDFEFDDREGCFDLIVNASALGMTGQPPLKFDVSHAPPGSVFYDIVMSPLHTDFLQAAQAAGFRTLDGYFMLIGQAAAAFEHFFGALPPRDNGDAELRTLLER